MATETRVRLSIEADKATGSIQAVSDELKKFGEDAKAAGESAKKGAEGADLMGEASVELTGQLQALVGGAAIAAFFKGAVEASLEEAEALRQVKFAVESTGQSWGTYKDRIDEFAAAQQAATQFDDGVTIQVLGRLTRATGDVEQAMKATALAQDIAAATGKDLSDTTRIVSDLMTGQERGLSAAKKELGAYVGEAQNGQQALDALQKGFTGAAADQDGWAKSLAQSKNLLGEFQQQVGDGIVPVFATLLKGVQMVAQGFDQLGTMIAGVAAASAVGIQGLAQAVDQVLSGNFRQALDTARQTKDGLVTVAEETGRNIEAVEDRYRSGKVDKEVANTQLVAKASQQEQEKAAEDRKQLENKLSEEISKIKNDEFDLARIRLRDQVDAAREAGIETLEVKTLEGEEIITLEQYKNDRLAEIQAEQTKKEGEEQKKRKAQRDKDEADQKKLAQERLANIRDTLAFIGSLQSAKTKEFAAIGKAAASSEAIISTYLAAQKAYAAMAGIPIVGPALGTAAAALAVTAGLARVAAINGVALEEGGLVEGTPGGIRATIGEKGKREAVIPLTNQRALRDIGQAISGAGGSGGGAGVVNNFYNSFNLPGGSALQDPAVVREILQTLADQMEKGTPEAVRAALNILRRSEISAGRAS